MTEIKVLKREMGLGALIIFALFFYGVIQQMPASWWFEVRSIEVADAPSGVCPIMVVDRTIRHPADGTYSVEVERVTSDPGVLPITTTRAIGNDGLLIPRRRGGSTYTPDDQLPVPMSFDWWLFDEKDERPVCPLPDGRYVIDTRWEFVPENPIWRFLLHDPRIVRERSNVFTIGALATD